MKTFTTLHFILFGLFVFQSCSSDNNCPKLQETEIFVRTWNATISSIVVKADDKIIFTSSSLDYKGSFYLKVGCLYSV
ncbi:hypothetical protein [Dysgonomonas capnocytophagoides]|uniref:hypothetical protein n=1 Tax=Dysgonomonas capnocytophagoides TaxID=45254 RepID=UPI0029232611|nr:hypothetical protein DCPSUM001_02250 [Dysgonomonas capnocytophagoides]